MTYKKICVISYEMYIRIRMKQVKKIVCLVLNLMKTNGIFNAYNLKMLNKDHNIK